jgi:hypothetical protein
MCVCVCVCVSKEVVGWDPSGPCTATCKICGSLNSPEYVGVVVFCYIYVYEGLALIPAKFPFPLL